VRYVYLWSLESSASADDQVLMGTDALLHLTQALEVVNPAGKLRIDLVTRGAQPAGQSRHATAVSQAPAIGLLRVIYNEHPNFSCRGIDLDPAASEDEFDNIWRELVRSDVEREVAFRGEARYVQRLDRGRPTTEQWLAPSVQLRLD